VIILQSNSQTKRVLLLLILCLAASTPALELNEAVNTTTTVEKKTVTSSKGIDYSLILNGNKILHIRGENGENRNVSSIIAVRTDGAVLKNLVWNISPEKKNGHDQFRFIKV
jgi:hypothetical protein